ncbi:MAG: class I SAM-dependent methyltransferase [Gaiellaceae bacterium]
MSGRQRLPNRALRAAVHLVFGTRPWVRRNVDTFAKGVSGKRILEIGSGRQDLGHDAYSFRELFDPTNEFVQSDVVPEYGHQLVDVRDIGVEDAFDVILCLYVLEHVFEVENAVRSMHRALAPGGTLVVAVPHLYPYHDEPTDYWRFTDHALRQLLEQFGSTEIRTRGFRKMPIALLAFARKADAA